MTHVRQIAVVVVWMAQLILPGSGIAARSDATVVTPSRAQSATPLRIAKRTRRPKKPKPPPPDPATPEEPTSEGVVAPEPIEPRPLPVVSQPPPKLPKKYAAYAILPVEGIDVGKGLVTAFEKALVNEIDETAGVRAIPPREVVGALIRYGLDAADCEGDTACLAQAGRYAGGHRLIETRVVGVAGTVNASLRLIDTRKAVEIRRVTTAVSDDPAERAAQVYRLAVQLLSPRKYVGSLKIKCSVDGADVYLDDKLVGLTPIKRTFSKLRAGTHILRIAKPGYSDVYRFVDVIYKRSSTITIDLDANEITGEFVGSESTIIGTMFIIADEPGITIRVDGEPVGITILEEPIELAAGRHKISMRKEGFPAKEQIIDIVRDKRTEVAVVNEGDRLEVILVEVVEISKPVPTMGEVRIAIANRPKPAAASSGLSWKFLAGAVTAGLGVAGIVLTSYLATEVEKRNGRARRLEERAAAPTVTRDELIELERQRVNLIGFGTAAETKQWISLGISVGLAVVGGGLLAWDLFGTSDSAAPATPTTTVVVVPYPQGGQLVVGATW